MPEPREPEERVGSYRVVRPLATGGTSDLLLARSEGPMGFERQVVLKRLADRFREDSAVARMFVTEAAAYARLSHPSIVRLFDFFSHDDRLVMVLELVDGLTLRRLKTSADGLGHELTDKSVLYVARRIFEALACAHAAVDADGGHTPIIHRDVNPSNVLVGWDGEVKIVDFGVARVTGLHAETHGGAAKGTLGYMAPEQVRGAPIGPATDVYGAGIVLWELLADRRAFARGKGTDVDLLKAMASPEIPSLDELRLDLDKDVRDLVRAALEIDRTKRTLTAEEAARILRERDEADVGKAELVKLLRAVKEKREGDKKKSPPSAEPAKVVSKEPSLDARDQPQPSDAAAKPRPPMKRRMSGLGPGIVVAQAGAAPGMAERDTAEDTVAPPAPRPPPATPPPATAPLVPVEPRIPVIRARTPIAEPPIAPPLADSELEIADNGLYVLARPAPVEEESLELLKARAAARAAARPKRVDTSMPSWKIGLGIAVGLPLIALGAYVVLLRDPGDGAKPPAPAPSLSATATPPTPQPSPSLSASVPPAATLPDAGALRRDK